MNNNNDDENNNNNLRLREHLVVPNKQWTDLQLSIMIIYSSTCLFKSNILGLFYQVTI